MQTRRRTLLLSLLAGLLGGLLGISALASVAPAASAATSLRGAELEVVRLHNQARAAAGLAPLDVHIELHTDSRDWSKYMAGTGRLQHQTASTGTGSYADSCAAADAAWRACAENIAMGYTTAAAVHQGWMNSSGHYRNIMNPAYNRVGIGVWRDGNGRLWWTARFLGGTTADTMDATSHPQDAPTSASGAVYDANGPQGTIYRLYRAYFLREPDRDGFRYWAQTYANGYGLDSISGDFARSREFTSAYGSVSDRDFVRLVYQNVLERSPDRQGEDYWVSKLRGGMSRGLAMIYFSDSQEFRNNTAGGRPPT